MPESAPTPCGYCRSHSSRTLFACIDTEGRRWLWRSCQDCGAAFLSPRPTPEQLAGAYGAHYYGESATKFRGLAEQFIEQCRHSRARRLARGLPAGAAALDVGCGNGGFLAALGRQGEFRLFGTELEGAAARRAAARPGLSLTVGPLQPKTFAAESFDLVTLFHVFEHLTEPRETLAILHRVLKPNGRLVLSFPNIASIQARVFRGNWLHIDPPRHLFLFPPAAFRRALGAAGFIVESTRFFSLEQNPYGFAQSMLNALLQERDVLYERLKGNLVYAQRHGGGSLLAQKIFAGLAFPLGIALDAVESALGLGATVEFTLTKQPPPTP